MRGSFSCLAQEVTSEINCHEMIAQKLEMKEKLMVLENFHSSSLGTFSLCLLSWLCSNTFSKYFESPFDIFFCPWARCSLANILHHQAFFFIQISPFTVFVVLGRWDLPKISHFLFHYSRSTGVSLLHCLLYCLPLHDFLVIPENL